MHCVQDNQFTLDYHDPTKRSIGNALLIELNDGTKLDEIVVEYPIGHKSRRKEGIPLLLNKFKTHLNQHFANSPEKAEKIYTESEGSNLENTPIDSYMDLYWG